MDLLEDLIFVKETKKIIKIYNINDQGGVDLNLNDIEILKNPEKYIFIKNTGVLDSKRKWVYEGDVIQCTEYTRTKKRKISQKFISVVFEGQKGDGFLVVDSDSGSANGIGMYDIRIYKTQYPQSKCVVLGNVFRNPNLLKKVSYLEGCMKWEEFKRFLKRYE